MIADFRLSNQLTAILVAFILGMAFGLTFDVIRFIRVLFGVEPTGKNDPPGKAKKRILIPKCVFAFILDLLASLLFTGCFCVLSYVFCYGKLRAYTLFPAAVGFILFRKLPGRLTSRASTYAARFMRAAARKTMFLALRPVRFALKKTSEVFRSFAGLVSRRYERVKRKQFTKRIMARLDALTDLLSDTAAITLIGKRTTLPDRKGGKGSEKHNVKHHTEAGASAFCGSLRHNGRETSA